MFFTGRADAQYRRISSVEVVIVCRAELINSGFIAEINTPRNVPDAAFAYLFSVMIIIASATLWKRSQTPS